MRIRTSDGTILRAVIAPAFHTLITVEEDGPTTDEEAAGGRASEFPTATLATWEWSILEATDAERAAMREHGILPEEHTLWVEDEKGRRHPAHLEFAACLNWDRLRCTTAQDHDEAGSDFAGCRVVAASPADVNLMRRFGLHLEGLDEIGERLEREATLKRAA